MMKPQAYSRPCWTLVKSLFCPRTRWLDDRARLRVREESPGSTQSRCQLMAGGGDPRESATESKPPAFAQVRVKGCGKSAPRAWQQGRHGKPHRVQDREGRPGASGPRCGCAPPFGCIARGVWRQASQMNGHPTPFARAGWTEPGLQAIWSFSFCCRRVTLIA